MLFIVGVTALRVSFSFFYNLIILLYRNLIPIIMYCIFLLCPFPCPIRNTNFFLIIILCFFFFFYISTQIYILSILFINHYNIISLSNFILCQYINIHKILYFISIIIKKSKF